MTMVFKALPLAFALLLSACGGDDSATAPQPVATPPPPASLLGATVTTAPFALTDTEAEFFPDIAYGSLERQRLDFFQPSNATPSALVIFFHGGGFEAGDKSDVYQDVGFQNFIDSLLNQNIAFASVNYRFLTSPGATSVETSLTDATRSLQFLRANASDAGFAPDRVVLAGGSAGSGAALFIGLSDDMADPQSSDPILRETTRVRGVFGIVPQVGYDFTAWETLVFADYAAQGFGQNEIIAMLGEDFLLRFYGINDLSELDAPDVAALRGRLDFLSLLTTDDPELFLDSSEVDGVPMSFDMLTHHPRHVQVLGERGNAVGRPVRALAPALGLDTTNGENAFDWVLRVLEN